MKKFSIFLLSLCLCFSLMACDNSATRGYIESENLDHNEEVETDYFEARILDVYDKSIVVEPIDGSNASKSSDKIDVTIDGVSVDFDLVVGGIVGITYVGSIAESYPAQITGTVGINHINDDLINEKVDLIPMVMINGQLYYDTGKVNTEVKCGTMDGEITSTVDGWEKPTEDNQSNFGKGYGYQWGAENTIQVNMDNKWVIFEARNDEGSMIQFNGEWYDKGELSEATLNWLELSEEERMLSSYFPPEFVVSSDICDRDNIQEEWGITLETQNVTSKGLTIVCHQLGGENISELTTGSYYVIQRLEDVGFVDVKYLPQEYDIAWTTEAWIIHNDATTTWEVNWEWLYGELPVGEYRIGKEIMNFRSPGDYNTEMIYAHFEIIE